MTGKPVVCTALLLSFLCIQPNLLDALENPAPPDSAVTVSIIDGTRLTGQIVSRDDAGILLVTPTNLEIKIPLASIISIEPLRGRVVEGVVLRSDPNYTRLMFAPTGRPLQAGDGYYSDYYVFFPGFSYGLTNHMSITAGLSLFPGIVRP